MTAELIPLSSVDRVMQMAVPKRSAYFRIFDHPRLRPPVVEEMLPDLEQMIAKTVRPYISGANVLLHEEDLRSVCYAKLTDLINKDMLDRCPTRAKFFGMAKTSFVNVIKSLVQREVYTRKRGYNAPTPGDSDGGEEHLTASKTINVSLDDPEAGLQVGDQAAELPFSSEILDDFKIYLTPIERLVVDQTVSPNQEACQLAWIDSHRGGSATSMSVTYAHQAEGLGIDVRLYRRVLESVRPKLTKFMNEEKNGESADAMRVRLAEATLSSLFGLQVPPSTRVPIRRRLYTLAARDKHELVTEDVAALLEEVGAYVPVMLGNDLSCLNVLWSSTHRACAGCMMQDRCRPAALALEMDQVVASAELLGKNFVRQPVVGPRFSTGEEPPVASAFTRTDTEAEILDHLNREFKRSNRDGLWFYTSFDGHSAYLFRAAKPGEAFHLLFQSPSESLRAQLTPVGKAWYLPEGIGVEEAKDLIDRHVNETMGTRKN